jgi:hypothetical protein
MLKLSILMRKVRENHSTCTSRSRENICSSSGCARKKERQDETQFTTKIAGKNLVIWVPVISLCKIFIPSYLFDGLLCWNWPFSPPNRKTLQKKLYWMHEIFVRKNVSHHFRPRLTPLLKGVNSYWHLMVRMPIQLWKMQNAREITMIP